MNTLMKLTVGLLFLQFAGCRTTVEKEQFTIPFLEGTWVMASSEPSDKLFVEEWVPESDTAFTGRGYIVNNSTGDIFNSEELWMNYKSKKWIYSARPKGAEITDFTATRADSTVFLFENPDHDFPQYIQYESLSDDSIQVSIGDTATSRSWIMVRER